MSMGIGIGYRLQDLPVGIGMIMQLIHVKYEYCFNIQGIIVLWYWLQDQGQLPVILYIYIVIRGIFNYQYFIH